MNDSETVDLEMVFRDDCCKEADSSNQPAKEHHEFAQILVGVVVGEKLCVQQHLQLDWNVRKKKITIEKHIFLWIAFILLPFISNIRACRTIVAVSEILTSEEKNGCILYQNAIKIKTPVSPVCFFSKGFLS